MGILLTISVVIKPLLSVYFTLKGISNERKKNKIRTGMALFITTYSKHGFLTMFYLLSSTKTRKDVWND